MSHTTEPYTQRFGDDKRTMRRGEMSVKLPLADTTAINVTIDPDKGQAMIRLGSCEIHGPRSDLEVVAAAFTFCVDRLSGTAPATEDDAASAARPCNRCTITHSPNEPCASVGHDQLLARAYERMAKTQMITPRAAGLFVDAAMMFVLRGDLAAAKMLLNHFVLEDVADEVVKMLVQVRDSVPTPVPGRNGASAPPSRNGAGAPPR